jgi:hypothetical protein
MNDLQILPARPEAAAIGRAMISAPSAGIGVTSKFIEQRLQDFKIPTPTFAGHPPVPAKSLEERLYDALAAFKVRTASVAMHLDHDWRSRLFLQLDSLLASDDWEVDDPPPSQASYSTFLRMLILLRPDRRPGLGATTDGNLIAAWTSGDDRLTIECMAQDFARWHLAVTIEGERERAAGITPLSRLRTVLTPYAPQRWFNHGNNLPAG